MVRWLLILLTCISTIVTRQRQLASWKCQTASARFYFISNKTCWLKFKQTVIINSSTQLGAVEAITYEFCLFQVAAPEIAMIKIAAPNMTQTVTDRAIQVVVSCLLAVMCINDRYIVCLKFWKMLQIEYSSEWPRSSYDGFVVVCQQCLF